MAGSSSFFLVFLEDIITVRGEIKKKSLLELSLPMAIASGKLNIIQIHQFPSLKW